MSEPIDDLKTKLKERATRKPLDAAMQLYGKLPPHARDLEEAILGALMLEKNAFTAVYDILHKDVFYVPAHQEIFLATKHLFDSGEPIDILTVTAELRKRGKLEEVGGAYYITTLTDSVASSAHIEYHARIVVQKYIMRELIQISSKIQKDAYEESTDVFTLLDTAEKSLYEITSKNLRRDYQGLGELLIKSINKLEQLSQREDGITEESVPTGFVELDRLTSGWQKSNLIICAARPGMGKTAFVLSVARNAAVDHKRPVAIFSLEMSSLELVNRLISGESELSSEKLRSGKLEPYEWQQLQSKIVKLNEAKIFIDDTPELNIFELRAKCRRLKQQHGVEMFIIDYLQLMTANSESKSFNREQEISTISRSLKALAKELETPVIALAQLSRAVETRGGLKRPQLSDLRESGSIEQDADIVMFLYRPEYYKFEVDDNGHSLIGIAELIVAKHRNGKTATVNCRFKDNLSKFVDLDPLTEQTTFELNGVENKQQQQYRGGGGRKKQDGEQSVTRQSKMNNDDEDVPW